MKLNDLIERVEYSLRMPNSSTEFQVYKIQTKNELKGLMNKYRVIRVLYNGITTYAWDAQAADHSFVKSFIDNSNDYCSMIINDGFLDKSLFENNIRLYNEFKGKYSELFTNIILTNDTK